MNLTAAVRRHPAIWRYHSRSKPTKYWSTSNGRDEFAGELADVGLYLLQLAAVSGIDLEQAILKKLEINAARTWEESPNKPTLP